jgi:pimeloyl-ACP methyl ester carboxylesterase
MVHCAIAGEGEPVLLLHQTPRSWLEYRDVLPILGRRRRAIAMDTAGFGDSSPLPSDENTIERWAEVTTSLLDALGLRSIAVVGHHTGAYIATELAAAFPHRISAVVLSGLSIHSQEERVTQLTGRAVVDDVDRQPDGSHLVRLWQLRASVYPDNAQLLERFIVDCLRAGDLAAEGHRVVARYDIEDRLPLVRCPALLIAGTSDPYAYPSLLRLREILPEADVSEIEGGMIPLPDQMPDAFAGAVEGFLDRVV